MRDSLELFVDVERAEVAGGLPLAHRRFLFATAPVGPFNRRLARVIRGMGAEALRAILTGGDVLDWGLSDAVFATGGLEGWPSFIERTIEERGITDLVVFGDSMVYCAAALDAARRAGIETWVLENGYRRPQWVTVERNGVNANSALPRRGGDYDDVEVEDLGESPPPVGAITPWHTIHMIAHFLTVVFTWPLFPNYRFPYAGRIWPQAGGYIRRYAVWLVSRKRRERETAEILADPRPFFLACLQRDGDSQLLSHSPIKTNRGFMAHVIRSFAAHAPADAWLVIKNHPLDPGLENYAEACKALAWSHGLAGRVRFFDAGPFAPLAHKARGVVAVNSTAALAAMEFGTPVKLLGRAFFDIEGLTDPKPLEEFWQGPTGPDSKLLDRVRRRITLRTQVWGNYHNRAAIERTAFGVAARFACPDMEFLA